jgi:hypothetical protein
LCCEETSAVIMHTQSYVSIQPITAGYWVLVLLLLEHSEFNKFVVVFTEPCLFVLVPAESCLLQGECISSEIQ